MKLLILLGLVISCSQTADVFRTKDGKYQVNSVAADKTTSIGIVKKSAKKYCEDKGLETVIESATTVYKGRHSETTNQDIKTASEIGAILTGSSDVYAAGDAARGRTNYETTLLFSCAK